jgi:hypothetical protein
MYIGKKDRNRHTHMTAELRDIPGFPGYAITRDGRVWSYPKKCSSADGMWLKSLPKSDGYMKVGLRKDGTYYQPYVHRLVLETFVGPCPEGMECCHNNGNPSDNRVENLRWDTHLENAMDAVRHGTCPRGEAHGKAKLTDDKVRQIVDVYGTGMFSLREIGARYGVSHTAVRGIVRGRTWGHLWKA